MNYAASKTLNGTSSKTLMTLSGCVLIFLCQLFFMPVAFSEIQSEAAFTAAEQFRMFVQEGHLDNVRKMVDNGFDPNIPFANNTSPLHLAVINNHQPIAAVLVQAGAKLESQEGTTQATPLHFAALYGRTEIAKLLIQKGADVNAKMKMGLTPLMVATQSNHPQIVDLLLSNKATVNQADFDGYTALHMAAENGDEIAAKSLLKHGAERNAKDNSHATPLMIATQKNNASMVKLLEENK